VNDKIPISDKHTPQHKHTPQKTISASTSFKKFMDSCTLLPNCARFTLSVQLYYCRIQTNPKSSYTSRRVLKMNKSAFSQLHMPTTRHCPHSLATHTRPFNIPLSGTTQVGQFQKKHSPTHTHPDHRTSYINFLHLPQSIAFSLFNLRASQSFWTTSLQVL